MLQRKCYPQQLSNCYLNKKDSLLNQNHYNLHMYCHMASKMVLSLHQDHHKKLLGNLQDRWLHVDNRTLQQQIGIKYNQNLLFHKFYSQLGIKCKVWC